MLTFLQILLLIAVIGSAALFRLSIAIWAPVLAVVLAALTYIDTLSTLFLIPLWIILALSIVLFDIPPLRRMLLAKPTLKFFKSALPPMSETERVAIEAGDVWWEGELFCGQPNWKKLLAYHKPTFTEAEQSFLNNQVETLCGMIDDWKTEFEDHNLPLAAWEYIKKERFWGMVIPPEFGGLGFSALAHSTIVMKIASRCSAAAITVMVPNSLGPGELIHRYGTDEQKQYYLPRLANGQEIPCFGLTGTEIGSDAGAMPDKGIICKGQFEGKEIIGIKLSWDKRYITLAPVATVLGIAFKLYDPDHLIGETTDIGITLCLVPSNHPGVTTGRRHIPLNIAFMNGPTQGKDVFVPLEWIIGGKKMVGQGWRMLMECLSIGRGISLPALAVASTKVSYRMTGAYARIRKQFKVPIGHFEGVSEAMARIAGYTYLLEATRVLTTTAIDQQIKPAIASAIAKYHMTELGRKSVNDAMDVHAGRGIQLGPRNYMGNLYQAQPMSITVEGANILTRNLIIFGQGAIRCHPYILLEMSAAADTDAKRGLNQFDKLLKTHIGYAVSNVLRALIYGLTGGKFIHVPLKNNPLACYYRQLTRMSTALAVLADIAMLMLGGELKRKETLSARLGDILSQLYLASAVVKYFEDQGHPSSDLPYVHWNLKTCLYNCQTAIEELLANFPHRILAFILRKIIFPYGRAYRLPKDKLSQQLVADMMEPTEIRDRLSQNMYLGKTTDDPTGRMEIAFKKWAGVEAHDKRLQAAIKEGKVGVHDDYNTQVDEAIKASVLSAPEGQLLKEYNVVRIDAILVDSFEPDYFKKHVANG